MRLIEYRSAGPSDGGIKYPNVRFNKINLIVGGSATGKTRLLNTLANWPKMIVENKIFNGLWEVKFNHKGEQYYWFLKSEIDSATDQTIVVTEKLIRYKDGKEKRIIFRENDLFEFNGRKLPKLSKRESGISILKSEDDVHPVFEGIQSIFRRNFSGSDLDNITSLQPVDRELEKIFENAKNYCRINYLDIKLSTKLFIIFTKFPETYKKICNSFKMIFPFIDSVELKNSEFFFKNLPFQGISFIPVFALKEKDADIWIPITEFSSGMKKVLLLLSDVYCMPEYGGVYLIDEYENSLGINAINYFPGILFEDEGNSQFILTSHHPYIIGNISVENWIVLHRKGINVQVKQGAELLELYGKSKQASFIKLINDPFYNEGIE